MKSRKVGENFGVEFYDVDVRCLTRRQRGIVTRARNEHGVVFFRNQDLDCNQHIEFSERFGSIVGNRFFERVDGHEQIAVVRKEPRHRTVVGESWHTDHSYDPAPAQGSILYAREVPDSGGDTLFSNMYMAYAALSDGLRKTLDRLTAVHSSVHVFSDDGIREYEPEEDRFHNSDQAVQTSEHPMVLVHPLSGRRALYINPCFTTHIAGWSRTESAALLEYLYRHTTREEFVTRFRWQQDSMAFWDNRAVMHRALNDYPSQRRIMHRVTLAGCPLSGPEDAGPAQGSLARM